VRGIGTSVYDPCEELAAPGSAKPTGLGTTAKVTAETNDGGD
jgi:hypothetical protein